MNQYPKSISIEFSGITLDDDFGLGGVNTSYQIKRSPHGETQTASTYLSNTTINGVLVMVSVTLSVDGNWVLYDLTKQSDLNNTLHVFDNAGPIAGNVQTNTLPPGGTATIS